MGPCTASASWGEAGVAKEPRLHLRASEAGQQGLCLGSNVMPVLGSWLHNHQVDVKLYLEYPKRLEYCRRSRPLPQILTHTQLHSS